MKAELTQKGLETLADGVYQDALAKDRLRRLYNRVLWRSHAQVDGQGS